MVKEKWGVCPKCGKKCIKQREDTVLINFPMHGKACKRDYVVNREINSLQRNFVN